MKKAAIGSVISANGISHAIADGQLLSKIPKDQWNRQKVLTQCGKMVTGNTEPSDIEFIRCRPCKSVSKRRPPLKMRHHATY